MSQTSRSSSGVLIESSMYSNSPTRPRPTSSPSPKPATRLGSSLGKTCRSGFWAGSMSWSGETVIASAMAIW